MIANIKTGVDMPIIAITNGLYTGSDKIVQTLGEKFNCSLVRDVDIIEKTHQTYQIKLTTLRKVVESKQIAFNNFTHEREKCLAALKKVLANLVSEGNCIFHGFLGLLIPREITHVMRVLVIEKKKKRIEKGMATLGLSKKEAEKKIDISDTHAISWTMSLFDKNPWDETLYDRVIHLDTLDPAKSVLLVSEHFKKFKENRTNFINKEVLDFNLSTNVEMALSDIGKGLVVKANKGLVVVTIDKKVKMLTKFQQKIIQTAETIPGVDLVKTRIGRNYYKNEKKQVTD
ncbi:MAG: cytidylate kinase-like family protein [Desulfobacteraceae bacterium]|nr:cytidylate kinase-like family protein [Desulfobacteraceae bacterium]